MRVVLDLDIKDFNEQIFQRFMSDNKKGWDEWFENVIEVLNDVANEIEENDEVYELLSKATGHDLGMFRTIFDASNVLFMLMRKMEFKKEKDDERA